MGATLKRETIFVSSGDNLGCAVDFLAHLKGIGIAVEGPFPLSFKAPVAKTLGGPLVDTEFNQVSVKYACDDEMMAVLIRVAMDIETTRQVKPVVDVKTTITHNGDEPPTVVTESKTPRKRV